MTTLEVHVRTTDQKTVRRFWDAIVFLAELMGLEIVITGG